MKLVILSRHTLFREALCELLTRRLDARVIASTADLDEAVAVTAELAPDLVLIDDFRIDDLLAACRALSKAHPDSRIAILQSSLSANYSPNGVCGAAVVSKDVRFQALADQIHEITKVA